MWWRVSAAGAAAADHPAGLFSAEQSAADALTLRSVLSTFICVPALLVAHRPLAAASCRRPFSSPSNLSYSHAANLLSRPVHLPRLLPWSPPPTPSLVTAPRFWTSSSLSLAVHPSTSMLLQCLLVAHVLLATSDVRIAHLHSLPVLALPVHCPSLARPPEPPSPTVSDYSSLSVGVLRPPLLVPPSPAQAGPSQALAQAVGGTDAAPRCVRCLALQLLWCALQAAF